MCCVLVLISMHHSAPTFYAIYRNMATLSPAELLEIKLEKAEDTLKFYVLELDKAQALLERALEKGVEELIGKARARIVTAEEAIAQAKEDIMMHRESLRAGTPAAMAAPISSGTS